MSLKEDSAGSSEGTCCCFSIMSWVKKVKELAGGNSKPAGGATGHGRKSNSKIGKENEMKMISGASKGTARNSELSKSDSPQTQPTGYVVIDKGAGQQEDITQREVDSVSGSSPCTESSSVCSETAAVSTPQPVAKKLQCSSMSNMPVAMSNATAIFHNNELLVGGAYTGRSVSDVLLHAYDSNFDIWSELPPAPLKWSALTSLDNKVVLVGGKEVGKARTGYTNKLAILDDASKMWSFFSPPMQVARLSPVVHSYSGYLIVAGGGKGQLDYNAEIFDPAKRQWTVTAPLPHKCFKHTSTAIDGVWYLLNGDSGLIFYTDISTLIRLSLVENSEHDADSSKQSPTTEEVLSIVNGSSKISDRQSGPATSTVWKSIEPQPPYKPFRITSIEGHLLALSTSKNAVLAHAYVDGLWKSVGKLPLSTSTASSISDPSNSFGPLYMFGGEGSGGQYSSKLFKISLVSKDAKKATLRVGLDTATFITNS